MAGEQLHECNNLRANSTYIYIMGESTTFFAPAQYDLEQRSQVNFSFQTARSSELICDIYGFNVLP